MHEMEPRQLRREARRLHRAGKTVEALKRLDQLIGLQAAQTDDWCMTGRLLCELGEFAQALGAFEHCLQLESQHLEARYELGRALYELGDADRAAALLEQVARETDQLEMWMGLATIAPAVPSFDLQRVRKIREKFAQLVRQAEAANIAQPSRRLAAIQRATAPLRVGYLSAHWHDANYMKPVWPLINAHQSGKIDIHLFDDGPQQQASWNWLHNAAQRHITHGLDNAQAAETIRAAKLDILVDLSAYSTPERLGVFVHRPAPLQIAWFNMYATSGFEEFDYIVGDRLVLNQEEQRYYSERCLQLPLSYLTFQTNHPAPDIATVAPHHHAPFTFGCLGTMYKITPQVVSTWSAILRQADGARLLLANRELRSQCNRQYLLDQFRSEGVAAERIEFLPPAEHFEFLRYYAQIDLALDTFPYNGGTTTMEAIWQGVPVLTFNGDRWAARTSRSLLGHSPLSEFVVDSGEEYIRTAVKYATAPQWQGQLQKIRPTMREQLATSKVCDSPLLARKMEALYTRVHKNAH